MRKKLILFGLLWAGLSGILSAQKMDICKLYGAVYITNDSRKADFVIYEEETEAFADLLVYKEDNKLFADQEGLWFFTEALGFAKFIVFVTDNKDLADFSVFYINAPAFAGCP